MALKLGSRKTVRENRPKNISSVELWRKIFNQNPHIYSSFFLQQFYVFYERKELNTALTFATFCQEKVGRIGNTS